MNKIKRYVLNRSITIKGKNVWGFDSHITFSPASDNGWYLYNPEDGSEVPINSENIKCKMNNLFIENGTSKMHVLEHILPLRWMGVDRARIHGSKWPPYLSAKEVWDILWDEGALVETEEFIPSFPVVKRITKRFKKGNFSSKTFIEPKIPDGHQEGFGNIQLTVHINYKGVGQSTETYNLDNLDLLCSSYPQGVSIYRYYVCSFLKLFGWSNFNKIIWLKGKPKSEILRLWNEHRALDILGMLAGIDHQKLPTDFHYSSVCGGHNLDLLTCQQVTV